jgi:sRNA-binding protein
MSQTSLNLNARDFDAYAAEKATSNAYSRPRLEVKQRALLWARGVVARLAAQGLAVDVHGSDEHLSLRNKKHVDCQWIFFSRDAAARDELSRLLDRGRSISDVIEDQSPYDRHAFLALRLDAHAVEVCFAVPSEAQVDLDNLRARLDPGADSALATALIDALIALPEEFTIGAGGEGAAFRHASSAATPEALQKLVARPSAEQIPLWVGWRVARETALEHAEILDEQLEDALVALAPIYRLVAWSRDNDRVALDRRLEGAEKERARAHAEAHAETERWRTEQEESRKRSQEQALARADEARRNPPISSTRRPSLSTLFAGKGSSPPSSQRPRHEPPASGTAPRVDIVAPAPATHPTHPTREEQASIAVLPVAAAPIVASIPLAPSRPAPTTIEKGAKVRVRSGPFVDKIGVIGELDSRGGARVLLGLLSTRLELHDLELAVETRERPAMQSSHRRPLAPLPRKAR